MAPHSGMKGVFIIMSHLNTIWMGVACNLVCYVVFTAKPVAASVVSQVSTLLSLKKSKSTY